ncbi:hypothetical protein I4U23_008629 [Adineta vaga]|nr:hypothetical protein I4U23_008629 [Adineta vaga]
MGACATYLRHNKHQESLPASKTVEFNDLLNDKQNSSHVYQTVARIIQTKNEDTAYYPLSPPESMLSVNVNTLHYREQESPRQDITCLTVYHGQGLAEIEFHNSTPFKDGL